VSSSSWKNVIEVANKLQTEIYEDIFLRENFFTQRKFSFDKKTKNLKITAVTSNRSIMVEIRSASKKAIISLLRDDERNYPTRKLCVFDISNYRDNLGCKKAGRSRHFISALLVSHQRSRPDQS